MMEQKTFSNYLSKLPCKIFSTLLLGLQMTIQSVLQNVDPCDNLTDDDIRTAVQNATGPKSALFVQDFPFEVLVRRQIARLLEPSLQCARFIYDELIKISRRCLSNELQQYPVLRKRINEVVGNFLRAGLEPSETMIGHIIEMEMDYINTSHPSFVGGGKAFETAKQQIKSSTVTLPNGGTKDGVEPDKASSSERNIKSQGILGRQVNGFVADQGVRSVTDTERASISGHTSGSAWGISSLFGAGDHSSLVKENLARAPYKEPVHSLEQDFSMIYLREPPAILRPSEGRSEQEAIEIAATKLLVRSYYDIVRKNIADSVPKAIMHFLVNRTKRELHSVFIKKLYRENLLEEMLKEPEEIATKRKLTREMLGVLEQAAQTLDELPLEAETVEKGYSHDPDPTGLPRIQGLPTSSMFSRSSGFADNYTSPRTHRSWKPSHMGDQHLHSHVFANADSNGNGRSY